MYVAQNLYSRYAQFIDLSDRDFFSKSLEIAIKDFQKARDADLELMTKKRAPIVLVSNLSARTAEETFIARKQVHDIKRAKRRFLMIDADFEAHQKEDSAELRERIIDFGEKYQTPVMIYPTQSFPAKPRFRAVFLTNTLLSDVRYEQAMRWLHGELGIEKSLDPADLRVTTNRNLPAFTNDDQVTHCFSTFDDENLEVLDWKLWKDTTELPKRDVVFERENPFEDMEFSYDFEILKDGASQLAGSVLCQKYDQFWKVVQSIALEVIEGRLDIEQAEEVVQILARDSGAEELKTQSWEVENVKLLHSTIERLKNSVEDRSKTRPMSTYIEFMIAIND